MGIRSYFKQDFTSQRNEKVDNGCGGWADVWSNYISSNGCIRGLKGDESFKNDKLTAESTHRLYCNILDIIKEDRIIFDGITFEVLFVNNVMQMGKHLQIDLKVVDWYGKFINGFNK